MAWIGLYRPDAAQIGDLASEFGLHELAVEDAVTAHQRPKLERYGDTLFAVLRTARYVDYDEEVDFGEVHVFVGPDFVITVRHTDAPDLTNVRARMESDPGAPEARPRSRAVRHPRRGRRPLRAGRGGARERRRRDRVGGLPRRPVGLAADLRAVAGGDRVPAGRPLALGDAARAVSAGFDKYAVDEELQRYLRDVADHNTQILERLDSLKQLLQNILTVNATLVGQQQNEEMRSLTEASFQQNEEVKKISALGRHPVRPDADRHRLRDELRAHARARRGVRLPRRAGPDGAHLRRPLPAVPPPRLALTGPRTGRDPHPHRHLGGILASSWDDPRPDGRVVTFPPRLGDRRFSRSGSRRSPRCAG